MTFAHCPSPGTRAHRPTKDHLHSKPPQCAEWGKALSHAPPPPTESTPDSSCPCPHRSVPRATWWWLPLGACRWRSGGCRPEQVDVDVGLPTGRGGHNLCSRGRGPSPMLVLPLPCPTSLWHKGSWPRPCGVPGLGPTPGEVSFVFQPTQGGWSPPSGPVFVMIWMQALP